MPPRRLKAATACARRTCTAPTVCPLDRPRRPDDRARRRIQRPKRRSRSRNLRARIRPACMHARRNDCFRQVNQHGEGETTNLPFPETDDGTHGRRSYVRQPLEARPIREAACEEVEAARMGGEISLDIEIAHATCQNCRILLVEAATPAYRRPRRSREHRRAARRHRDLQLLGRAGRSATAPPSTTPASSSPPPPATTAT